MTQAYMSAIRLQQWQGFLAGPELLINYGPLLAQPLVEDSSILMAVATGIRFAEVREDVGVRTLSGSLELDVLIHQLDETLGGAEVTELCELAFS